MDQEDLQAQDLHRASQMKLVYLCIVCGILSLFFRLLYWQKFETTSLLFICLPTLLAIAMALTPKAKSAVGMAMKGLTIGLLISGIFFGEGVVCILMAAILAYPLTFVIAVAVERFVKKRKDLLCLAMAPLFLMSLEGSTARLSFDRDESVTVFKTVKATPDEVAACLAATPEFRTELPLFFRIGFPRPIRASGDGLLPGNGRRIHFAGGEGRPGDLILAVSRRAPGMVSFRAIEDASKIDHWLQWNEAVVTWERRDRDRTEISWTLHYRRGLDPAWYFGPWERYAVKLAGAYLIDNLATPVR